MNVRRKPIILDKVYQARKLESYHVMNTMAGEEVYPPYDNWLLTNKDGEQFVVPDSVFSEDYEEIDMEIANVSG